MNNSTSVSDGLIKTSLDALKNTVVANIGYILIGLFSVVSNGLEIATVITNKKLRTRCYFLITNESVACVIYGFSYVVVGIKRLIRLYLQMPEVNTKLHCAGEMFTCVFGQAANVFLPLSTAVDRIYATANPIKYKNMGSRFTIVSAAAAWMMATLHSSFTFSGEDQQKLVSNCNLVSATDLLYIVQSSVELTVTSLITICYFIVTLVLRNQLGKAKTRSENLAALKMKTQIKVVKTLGIESIVHLFTQFATRIGLAILAPMSPEVRFMYAPFIRLVMIAGSGMSLIIFLIANYEFKTAFKNMISFTRNNVLPMESHG